VTIGGTVVTIGGTVVTIGGTVVTIGGTVRGTLRGILTYYTIIICTYFVLFELCN
jgi:hypothetical protein